MLYVLGFQFWEVSVSVLRLTQQRKLRKWVEELSTQGMDQSSHDEILDIILANLSYNLIAVYK